MSDEPLGRRVYERHLDLLLAEELSCSPRFARWFLSQVFGDGVLPDGNPISVTVEISRLDNEVDDTAAGEDDLFVTAHWADGAPWVVLVEDKLDAVLQPRQVERYLARVDHLNRQGLNAAAAVVAPDSYLTVRAGDLEGLASVSVEDIAARLAADAAELDGELAARLTWRARQLVAMKNSRRIAAPDHPPTVELRDWIIEQLAVIDPTVRPDANSMRTVNTTWLFFEPADWLILKLDRGIVDVYPAKAHPGYQPDQPPLPIPDGFAHDTDTVGNIVLRWRSPETFDLAALRNGERPPALTDALHACSRADLWLSELSAGPPPRRHPQMPPEAEPQC